MGECIPIIEPLQSSLISLLRKFPEASTLTTTALDNAEPLPNDAPIPGSNPATAFTNNAFNDVSRMREMLQRQR